MLFRIHSNFKFLIYFDHIAGVPGTAASPPPRWRSSHSAEMGCVWLQLCQVKMSRTPYKMIIAENFCRRYWSSMYFQSEHLLLYFFICRSKITKITVSSNLITPCQGVRAFASAMESPSQAVRQPASLGRMLELVTL